MNARGDTNGTLYQNKGAYEIGKFFEVQIGSPYSTWWTWASQSLIYLHSSNPSSEELHGLEELDRLLKQQRQIFAQPLSV